MVELNITNLKVRPGYVEGQHSCICLSLPGIHWVYKIFCDLSLVDSNLPKEPLRETEGGGGGLSPPPRGAAHPQSCTEVSFQTASQVNCLRCTDAHLIICFNVCVC